MQLQIIMTSTRDGRVGMPIAEWFTDFAKTHGKFELKFIDLKEVALPMFDEPHHPSKQQYVHEHTKQWSALVKQADAYVFVVPEYNHMLPPALLNALDYLVVEWAYKPVGFVSYGGVSGGTRSVESALPMLAGLKLVGIPEAVNVPFFTKSITDGKFNGDIQEKAATGMLNELHKWATALRTMR